MHFNVSPSSHRQVRYANKIQVEGPKGAGVVRVHMIRDPDTMQYEYKYLLLDVKGTPYASPYSAAIADEAPSRSSQTLSEEYRRDPKEEEEEARTASIWSRVAMSCPASPKGKEPCRATSSARCNGLRNVIGAYPPRLLAKRYRHPRTALRRIRRAETGCVRKCNDWDSTHVLRPTAQKLSQGHSAKKHHGMAVYNDYSNRKESTTATTANVECRGPFIVQRRGEGQVFLVDSMHASQPPQASWRCGRRGVQSKLRWIMRQKAVSWRRVTALCPSLHNSEHMP